MYILQSYHYEQYEYDYATPIAVSESIEALKQRAIEDEEVFDQQWNGNELVVSATDDEGRDCGLKGAYTCDYYTISEIENLS